MLISMFLSVLTISSMVLGPFMPGITVDSYGRMVVDLDKTRAAIQKVIPPTTTENTARGDMVLSQIDQIVKATNEYNDAFASNGKEFARLYMIHGSKPEDFKGVFTQMDAAREKGQKKILDALFKMKQAMTPQEWEAVFKPQG